MTEQNNDDTAPLPASPPPAEETRTLPPDPVLSAPAAAGPPAPPPGPRFRDKLWSLRAVIAVALASVLLGGAGGAAIANLTNGNGNDGRMGPGNRFGPGELQRGQMPGGGQFGRGGGGGRFGGGFGGPGDFNGQQQGQQGTVPPGAPSAPSPQGASPGAVS
jgi:hypothetical protein